MPFDFLFPDVGEGITEGEIVAWKVKEGDQVKQDQVIAEIETDKAVVEIPAPRPGIILRIHHQAGDTVKVGEILVTIGEKGEKAAKPLPPAPAPPETAQERPASVVGEIPETIEGLTPHIEQVVERKLQEREDQAVLPAVRRLAKDLNVDLATVPGTGKDGRVTEQDVRAAAKGPKPAAAARVVKKYDMWGHVDREPLKGIRKATAVHMREAVSAAALVTHMEEVDITALWDLRQRENKKLKEHLTFMPFIVKAVIKALKKHPYLNASLDEEHEEILLKKYYNIGIAVDSDGGLLVPVIKVADQKSIASLSIEIAALAEKVRTRKVDLADLKGGTFTITNVGAIGGVFATPIPNHPEAAILATGAIRDRPVAVDGIVKIRKILPLSLTFDHRILDGAEAARFTNDLCAYLEDPDLLLLEG